MKNKSITHWFLMLMAVMLFTGCPKGKSKPVPEADRETQSAQDVAWMTYVVSDIDQMTAFCGVNDPDKSFYVPINTSTIVGFEGDIDPIFDPPTSRISMVFYKTHSQDSRYRTGEIRLRFDPNLHLIPQANPNAMYYHKYGFAGELTLTDYYIDRSSDTAREYRGLQWLVTMPVPGMINNEMKNNNFNAATEKLTWRISGKFKFKHPIDISGASDMTWEGTIYKTLENTNDPNVYDPARNIPINWWFAKCGYYGEVTGTMGNTSYRLSISENEKLIRDFTCTPDRVGSYELGADGSIITKDETHHPFVRGVASFTPGDKYPRRIYFGNESNSKLNWQCDNTGEVIIKGIVYTVNFIK